MMAPRQGFRGNRKVIGQILRSDPGVGAALDKIADEVAARSGGQVEKGMTDRQTRIVKVGAADQAVDGVATKALGSLGLTLS